MQHGILAGQVVLVVEDDQVIAQSICKALEYAGAEVTCTILPAVTALIKQRMPSALVLDCHPVSGERRVLIRRLRHHRLPYLFDSSEPPGGVTTERNAPFIPKPCPPEIIVAAVRYLLGRL